LIFKFLEYPSYSLDLVYSDFHVAGPLKMPLQRFMFRKTGKRKMRPIGGCADNTKHLQKN